MTLQEERKMWEERIKYPFVGDLQQKLDEFQEKLLAAGEPVIFVPNNESNSCFLSNLFGFRF